MKTTLFTVTLTLLAFFPLLATAELTEEANRFKDAVLAPTKAELDATVDRNTELAAWNAEHEGTLTKLNALAEILSCKWDTDGEKNQKCENDVRDALTTLWNLDKDEAIESLTDLKGLVKDIRDRKIPDTEVFQFSNRTRGTYFDGLLKQIDILETTAEANEEAVPYRVGPHGIAFPTISADANGKIVSTSAQTLATEKVEKLTAYLAKGEKLQGALLSCPSRETVAADIKKIEKLIAANEMEMYRLLEQSTKVIDDETLALANSKTRQNKAVQKAERDRTTAIHNAARALITDSLTIAVTSADNSGKVTVLGKEITTDHAESILVEAMADDVLTESFQKNGHANLLTTLKRLARAEVSEKNPASLAKIAGLDFAEKFAAKVTAGGQAALYVTKVDLQKIDAIPTTLKLAIAAIEEAHGKTLTQLESEQTQRAGAIEAAATKELDALNGKKEAKQAEHRKLALDRSSLNQCHATLPILAGKVKAMKKGVSEQVIDETKHELDLLKQEFEVPSLRTK